MPKKATAKKPSAKKPAARKRSSVQSCVLKSLKLHDDALTVKFKDLWPHTLQDPIDHIDEACRPNNCYKLTRMELDDKIEGKPINNLADFIKLVES